MIARRKVGRNERHAAERGAVGTPFAAQVEDDRGDCVPLTLYNALAPDVSLREAQAHFPKGTRLAVKEPYLKLSNAGTLTAVWIPTTGLGATKLQHSLARSNRRRFG